MVSLFLVTIYSPNAEIAFKSWERNSRGKLELAIDLTDRLRGDRNASEIATSVRNEKYLVSAFDHATPWLQLWCGRSVGVLSCRSILPV